MRLAEKAWSVVGLAILAYEVTAPRDELLSHGVDRMIEKHPIATRFIIVYLALHLCNWWPKKIDPLSLTIGKINR